MPETLTDETHSGIPSYTDESLTMLERVHLASKTLPTQTAIAQALGVNQSTVSRHQAKLNPTIEIAKLRAHNLAHRAVEKLDEAMDVAAANGRSGPQEVVLKMAGFLGDESKGAQVIVQIGMKDSDVSINLSPPSVNDLQP